MVSPITRNKIIQLLEEKSGIQQHIKSVKEFSGGSINRACRIETETGNYFVKVNEAKKFPGMFEAEAKGLKLLKNAECISVPEVLQVFDDDAEQFILMEYIFQGTPEKDFHFQFGKSLAYLHKNTTELFGLDHDNYIGSLRQSNKLHKHHSDFFINERIMPQLKMAIDSGAAEKNISAGFDRLFKVMKDIIPDEAPALLHGDLWSGNYTCGKNNKAWIFDPAVYYGHREADIAMTKLFGGFGSDFYAGYDEEFPLAKGWESRVDIFNLYPLLVHVNLFGGHYIYDVERILERY